MNISYESDFLPANEANARMLFGSFFSRIELSIQENALIYSTFSDELKDYSWNYCFLLDFDLEHLKSSLSAGADENLWAPGRGVCVPGALPASDPGLKRLVPQHRDIWLKASSAWRSSLQQPRLRVQLTSENGEGVDHALAVFRSSYIDPVENPFGYSGLDESQLAPMQRALDRRSPKIEGVVGYQSDSPVALALVCLWESWGGIYSVAVDPQHRRKGYGREISIIATNLAFERGAANVFLQTAPGTGLAVFYTSVGYAPWFESHFYQIRQG